MDPWDLITLVAPVLEEATTEVLDTRDLSTLHETGPAGLELAALSQLRMITPGFVGWMPLPWDWSSLGVDICAFPFK